MGRREAGQITARFVLLVSSLPALPVLWCPPGHAYESEFSLRLARITRCCEQARE